MFTPTAYHSWNVSLTVQASSPAISSQLLVRQSRTGRVRESASMRRSVGMRESMCLFLQLEGAVEGQNGFEPEEVLQVCSQPVQPYGVITRLTDLQTVHHMLTLGD